MASVAQVYISSTMLDVRCTMEVPPSSIVERANTSFSGTFVSSWHTWHHITTLSGNSLVSDGSRMNIFQRIIWSEARWVPIFVTASSGKGSSVAVVFIIGSGINSSYPLANFAPSESMMVA